MFVVFGVYFVVMLFIGWIVFWCIGDYEDYMFGGCNLLLWVVVFSVGVFDMLGWLVMGFFGVIYVFGFIEVWIVIGFMIGVYLNWLFVVLRFCVYM